MPLFFLILPHLFLPFPASHQRSQAGVKVRVVWFLLRKLIGTGIFETPPVPLYFFLPFFPLSIFFSRFLVVRSVSDASCRSGGGQPSLTRPTFTDDRWRRALGELVGGLMLGVFGSAASPGYGRACGSVERLRVSLCQKEMMLYWCLWNAYRRPR